MYKVLLPQEAQPFSLVVTRRGQGHATDTQHQAAVFNSTGSRWVATQGEANDLIDRHQGIGFKSDYGEC